ncbi:MAG: choice-of-anchor D domain-containing protein [Ignavibacteria bacterium]|nr:choice-of-anchor D domain-containing protein [Ignavibacteria bacterium]
MTSLLRRFSDQTRLAWVLALTAIIMMTAVTQTFAQPCSYGYGNIIVTSPATGSTWVRNTTLTIRWYGSPYTAGNYGGKYDIYYSSNSGTTWNSVASRVDGYATSFNWTIPASVTPGSAFRIRVDEYFDPSSWYCTLSNPGYTGNFTVTKGCFPPTMTQQPVSQTVCTGTSASMSVASDMMTGTYEWYKDGALIATTRSNVYTISPVTLSAAGVYNVVLRDDCNPSTATITSASGRLTVIESPSIRTDLPTSRTVCESANDTLRIRSVGAGRRFQWFKNGAAITGATDSNYVVNNAGTTSTGSYYCVVSGTCTPPAQSVTCSLVVATKPRVTVEPNNLDICPGTNGTIGVTATGLNLVYQWFKDGKAVPGGFNSTLTFNNYDYSMNGQYYCQIASNIPNPNNCVITAQTRTIRVSGFRPPKVKTQPRKTIDACLGAPLSVLAEYTGTGLSYEWYKDGKLVANSNSNELVVAKISPTSAGKYVVVATGTCGLKTTSDTINVTVLDKPSISKQPEGAKLTVGDRLDLTLEATDIRAVQWHKNDVAIPGATTTTYTKNSVVKSDAGFYTARITNSCGGVVTNYAKVEVNDPVVPRPAIELGQVSAEFGEIPVGYDKTITLNGLIKNVGNAPLSITALNIAPSDFSVSNAPATPFEVAPGAAQTITIKAAPTAKGPLFGSLTILSNAPLTPQASVALSATYVLRYNHPASQDFGLLETGKSTDKCVTVTNTSAQEVTIDQATVIGLNASEFTVTTAMPVTIAAGASAEICVKFAPGTAGKKSAQLSLRSSSGGNATIDLTGSGEVPGDVVDATEAGISVSPNPVRNVVSLNFGKALPEMNISIVSTSGQVVTNVKHDAVEAGSTFMLNIGETVASGSYSFIIRIGNDVMSLPFTVIK